MEHIDINEIEKTEQMVNSLMANNNESLTDAENAMFEVSIEDINSSLNGIDESNDSSAKHVKNLKNKTKKTMTQLADDVVNNYLADKSDKNWKALQEFFWYGIMQFSYRYTQNWDDAYDMTIETFIRALEKMDSYDPSIARFSTWLWTICRNNCIRFIKQKAKIPTVNNDISDIYESELTNAVYTQDIEDIKMNLNTGVDNLETEDPCKELYNVSIAEMDKMNDLGSKILKMKLVKNMKIREIATELGLNESTVKNHLYRSKENLSRILKINHKDLYDLYIESGADND